jgi:hypothetical protein
VRDRAEPGAAKTPRGLMPLIEMPIESAMTVRL